MCCSAESLGSPGQRLERDLALDPSPPQGCYKLATSKAPQSGALPSFWLVGRPIGKRGGDTLYKPWGGRIISYMKNARVEGGGHPIDVTTPSMLLRCPPSLSCCSPMPERAQQGNRPGKGAILWGGQSREKGGKKDRFL